MCVPAVPHFPGDKSFGALDTKLIIYNREYNQNNRLWNRKLPVNIMNCYPSPELTEELSKINRYNQCGGTTSN